MLLNGGSVGCAEVIAVMDVTVAWLLRKREVDDDSTKILCVKCMDSTHDEGEACGTSKSFHTVLSIFEDQLLCKGRVSEICAQKHFWNGLHFGQGNGQRTKFLGLVATKLFTLKLVTVLLCHLPSVKCYSKDLAHVGHSVPS